MASDSKVIGVVSAITATLSLLFIGNEIRKKRNSSYASNQALVQQPLLIHSGDPAMIPTAAGAFNNPGNIRKSPTDYEGEVDLPGSDFTSFVSMGHGYRAMIQALRHYYWNGKKSLTDLISTYAPSDDNNDVDAYIKFVSDTTGFFPSNDMYNVLYSEDVKRLIGAMSIHEQPVGFVPQEYDLTNAYNLLT